MKNFLSDYKSLDGQAENGEDGILKNIFNEIGKKCEYCIEFGAGNGIKHSVTFPFRQEGAKALLMDGIVVMDQYFDKRKFDRRLETSASVSQEEILNSQCDVKVEFISRENVNEIFIKHGVIDNIDLLVIDIDGNDYYIWEALKFNPLVVMIEFNKFIDPALNIVIKYNPEFKTKIKSKYLSASCQAMYFLGRLKGYTLLEVHADNMIFIRNEFATRIALGSKYQNDWLTLYMKDIIQNKNINDIKNMDWHRIYAQLKAKGYFVDHRKFGEWVQL